MVIGKEKARRAGSPTGLGRYEVQGGDTFAAACRKCRRNWKWLKPLDATLPERDIDLVLALADPLAHRAIRDAH